MLSTANQKVVISTYAFVHISRTRQSSTQHIRARRVHDVTHAHNDENIQRTTDCHLDSSANTFDNRPIIYFHLELINLIGVSGVTGRG